jgi:hypothetical protein
VSGVEDIREGLRIQLDRNDTTRAMSTYNNVATIQIALGYLDDGRKLIEEAIVYGTNRGLPAHVDWSRNTRNEALFPLGEWDECLKVADELVEEDAKRGGSQVGTFARAWSASVRFFRGDTSASLLSLEEGLESAREIQDPQALIPILSFLVLGTEAAGDSKRAGALAAEFAEITPEHPIFLAGSIEMVAQAMRRLGLVEQLATLTKVAKPIGPSPTAQVDLARAAVAEAHGDLDQSFEILASVIESCDQMVNRFLGTLARIDAARVAGLLQKDEEKSRLLDEAEVIAEVMRARRFLDQIAEMRDEGRETAAAGRQG